MNIEKLMKFAQNWFVDVVIDCLDGRTDNERASCAGDLQFKSRTCQSLHSVANGSPPGHHFNIYASIDVLPWR